MRIVEDLSRNLALRSSRRQFFKFMTATSLGTGLYLSRTGVAAGSLSGCIGCGGGPCSPCVTCCGAVPCAQLVGFPCKTCQQGGGCPEGCQTSGEWFCCSTRPGQGQCRRRCSECNCPPGCQNASCYCFTELGMSCTPKKSSAENTCTCPPQVQVPAIGVTAGAV